MPRPLQRPHTANKLQKIVNINSDISETINDRELGFRCLVRSASSLREHATPTLTPTNRPILWRPQISC